MRPDIVLLDDDELVCSHWETRCRRAQRRIRTFRRGQDLLNSIDSIHTSARVFIDKNLNQKPDGITVSKQLYSHGFQNVYLSTAEDSRFIPPMQWVKGVVGKTPPFWLLESSITAPLTEAERKSLLAKMSIEEFATYRRRIAHFLEVASGQNVGAFPGPDLSGFCLPDIVLNAWERAITSNLSDEQIKMTTDYAWRLV